MEDSENIEIDSDSDEYDKGPTIDPGLLIELIQNYEYLYNLSHEDFKNGKEKEEAWRDIAETLGSTAAECQKLWKNLRDRFNREKKLKSGEPAKEIKWKYFNKMLFYNKYTKPRKTHTTTPPAAKKPKTQKPVDRSSSSCSAWSENTNATIFSLDNRGGGDSSTNRSEEELDTPLDTPTTSRNVPSTSKLKENSGRKLEEVSEIVGVARKIAATIQAKSALASDPNRTFAEYMYSRLSEMPPEMAQRKRKALLIVLEDI